MRSQQNIAIASRIFLCALTAFFLVRAPFARATSICTDFGPFIGNDPDLDIDQYKKFCSNPKTKEEKALQQFAATLRSKWPEVDGKDFTGFLSPFKTLMESKHVPKSVKKDTWEGLGRIEFWYSHYEVHDPFLAVINPIANRLQKEMPKEEWVYSHGGSEIELAKKCAENTESEKCLSRWLYLILNEKRPACSNFTKPVSVAGKASLFGSGGSLKHKNVRIKLKSIVAHENEPGYWSLAGRVDTLDTPVEETKPIVWTHGKSPAKLKDTLLGKGSKGWFLKPRDEFLFLLLVDSACKSPLQAQLAANNSKIWQLLKQKRR